MQSSGVGPEDVDYVNAHATSTMAGDMAEYRALRAAIPGDHVRMNATKSMIGHLLGGAGAVEAVATVQAIRTGAQRALNKGRGLSVGRDCARGRSGPCPSSCVVQTACFACSGTVL